MNLTVDEPRSLCLSSRCAPNDSLILCTLTLRFFYENFFNPARSEARKTFWLISFPSTIRARPIRSSSTHLRCPPTDFLSRASELIITSSSKSSARGSCSPARSRAGGCRCGMTPGSGRSSARRIGSTWSSAIRGKHRDRTAVGSCRVRTSRSRSSNACWRHQVSMPLGGISITAEFAAHEVTAPGEQVLIDIDMTRAVLIDPQTDKVI